MRLGLALALLTCALACSASDETPDAGTPDGGEVPDAGSADGPYTLNVLGEGFGAHDGQAAFVALVRSGNGQVDAVKSASIDATASDPGAFTTTFPSMLVRDRSYRLDLFADVNGDGLCDPGDDASWRVALGAATGDAEETVSGDLAREPAACASFARFDLTFKGERFDTLAGRTVRIALVNDASSRTVATRSETIAEDGGFEAEFTAFLGRAASYHVDFFVDEDGDDACTFGSADEMWRVAIGPVTHGVTLGTIYSRSYVADACAAFGN